MNIIISVEPVSWNWGKWRAMACTEAFGNVFILKEASMEPVEFETKEEVDNFIIKYKNKWSVN